MYWNGPPGPPGGMGFPPPMPRLTLPMVKQQLGFLLHVAPDGPHFERVSDEAARWKHACPRGGVAYLKTTPFSFPNGDTVLYAGCPHCGRVLYCWEKAD